MTRHSVGSWIGTALFTLQCLIIPTSAAWAQVTSTWWNSPNFTDWLEPITWDNGVPNSPLDTARVAGSTSSSVVIDVTAPVTVAQLDLFDAGTLTIRGPGPLTFDRAGSGPALLETYPTSGQGVDAALAVPIAAADDAGLVLNVAQGNMITLSGGIASAGGDATKTGEGKLVLTGDSVLWGGEFTVADGLVLLRHVNGLGNTSGVTTIAGGRLLIGDETPPPRGAPPTVLGGPLKEPVRLEGGVLQTTQNFLELEGRLDLAANNSAVVHGPFTIRGGATGEGDLRIIAADFARTAVQDSPLAHAGGVEITSGESVGQFAKFYVDNSYGGPTRVDNVQLEVYTPGGLGEAAVGASIVNGSDLRLHGGSAEDVDATDSTISLWSAETALAELRPMGRYSLHNSRLTTYGNSRGADLYVLTQPISLSGAANEIETDRGGLRIAGGIRGSGNLLLDPANAFPIEIASPVELEGLLEVRGGPVQFVEPGAFHGEVFAQNGGRIVVPVDQEFDRVRIGSTFRQGCCSAFGSVEVDQGATLKLDRLEMVGGRLQGSIEVAAGITFDGFFTGRTLSHLDTGLDVRMNAGVVKIDDSTPGRALTNARVHLQREREAAVAVAGGTTTNATFFLNNGSGVNFNGALILEALPAQNSLTTLRGDIHLGESGAYIGGLQQQTRVEGQVFGGDLNVGRGTGLLTSVVGPGLNFVSGPLAYHGSTRVYLGRISLSENARLINTDRIEVFANGAVFSEFSASDPVSDRIKDSTPVELSGGEFAAWPTEAGVDATERVDAIRINRGFSSVHGSVFTDGLNELAAARLVVGEVFRSAGAVLTTQPIQERKRPVGSRTQTPLRIESGLSLTNGILPPWLLANRTSFSTLGPGGVEEYAGPMASLATSNPTSIVRPNSPEMLADRSVYAWSGFGNTPDVNLNGHRLTIGSGGLIGPKLSNGVLLPGADANGELIIATDFKVNADIQDNGSPTSVVYVGDGEIGGTNTYTGKTYVVGLPGDDVIVRTGSAMPAGGDVEINGGNSLVLRDPNQDFTYDLGEVTIRDGGSLSMQTLNATLRARSIQLESGTLGATLVGDFPMAKTTKGLATIAGLGSPEYTGTVDVFDGTLYALNGFSLYGNGVVNVHPDGRLVLPLSNGSNSAELNLYGGSLLGKGNGDGTSWRGVVRVLEDSTILTLDGLDDETIAADITVDGTIVVEDGKTLSVVGRTDSSRGLRASNGIHLGVGSTLGGTGSVRAPVRVAQGAILSPGLNAAGTLSMSLPIFKDELDESLMVWGEGGRYRWEINDANGTAGAPSGAGWDLLRVGVLLEIESTHDAPFVIEPVPLTAEGGMGAFEGLDATRSHRWLIAEIGTLNSFSAAIIGFEEDKFAIDITSFQAAYPQLRQEDFWLTLDTEGIYLNVQFVPEPAGLAAISLLFAMGTAVRRRGVRHAR